MKRNLLILMLFLCCVSLSAQEVAQNEAMAFSRILPDPLHAGMGYAGRASGSGVAWAAFSNLSAVPFLSGTADVAASCQRWAPGNIGSQSPSGGSLVPAFGGAVRVGRAGFALGYLGNFHPFDPDLGLAPADHSFGGGAAYALTDCLSAGAGVRVLRSDLLPDETLQAFAFDLSASAVWDHVRLCAALSDAGRLVRDSGRYGLPSSLALAGEWSASFGPGTARGGRSEDGRGGCNGGKSNGHGPHSIRIDADLDWFFHSGCFTAALGVEYGFRDVVFFRAGYHLAAGSAPALPSFATLGAGFRLYGVRLDLAWLTGNDVLGNTLSFGIGVSLE